MKTRISKLLAFVLAVCMMANYFAIPGLAAAQDELCTCKTPKKGTLINVDPATCTEWGTETYTCANTIKVNNKNQTCGKQFTVLTDEPLGHDMVVTPGYPATCTEDGLTDAEKCSRCGLGKDHEVIPAGHTPAEPVEENRVEPADCVTPGSYDMVVYCTVCGEELSRETFVIECIGEHTPGEPVKENEVVGDCTTPNSYDMVVYCTVCGNELERESWQDEAPNHDYDEGVLVREATCTLTEQKLFTCKTCGEKVTLSTAKALGHKWDAATCTEAKTCSVCGTTSGKPNGHSWKNPVCAEENECTICGETVYPAGVQKDHTPEATPYVAPTCTEYGKNPGVACNVCGHVFNGGDPIDPNGHTWKNISGKSPTCTATGKTAGVQCSVCKVWDDPQDVIPALGHDKAETLGYSDPTCVLDIHEVALCGRCNKEYYIPMPGTALGHDTYVVDENVIPALCEKDGSKEVVTYCARCNDENGNDFEVSRVKEVIPMTNHPLQVLTPAKPATCTQWGCDEKVTCAICNKILKIGERRPPLEHDWKEKEFCHEVDTCLNCGLTEGEPGEHTWVEATYDNAKYCSVCNYVDAPAIAEEIEFTYKAYGINGSANAVNSGYVTVEVYMNVKSDFARLWGIDVDLAFNPNLNLLSVDGCIFEQNLSTPVEIANQRNEVKLTQDMGFSTYKIFEKGEYLFATLSFKVDKNFYSEDVAFEVIEAECKCSRNSDLVNEVIANFGVGTEIHVNMLGDADLDGKITTQDNLMFSEWIANADLDSYETIYDMDKDGDVDGDDFALLRGAIVYDNSYLDK